MNTKLSLLLVTIYRLWSVSSHVLPDVSLNDSLAVMATSMLYPTLPITVVGSKNEKCRLDSQRLLDNLRNSTTWAAQMFDASVKSVGGLLVGDVRQLGNFDECVGTVTPIQGQYCLATLTLRPPASAKLNYSSDYYDPFGSAWDKISRDRDRTRIARNVVFQALCVPASCSSDDVIKSTNLHLMASLRNDSAVVKVTAALCQEDRKDERFSDGSVAYCVVLAGLLLVVVLSTFYDRNNSFPGEPEQQQKNGKKEDDGLLQSFSLKKNLLEISHSPKSSLNSLHGVRFITACFVICGHRLLVASGSPLHNYEYLDQERSKWYQGFVTQSEVIVDTFLLISGILVTCILLQTLEKKSVNPFQAIILRYLRLTPVYAVVIFFYATVMYHMGGGPIWPIVIGPQRENCLQNWWANLLYVNNYVNADRMCMIHSWYLPCDFHYFIVALFLVMLIHKSARVGYVTLGLLTVVSVIVPFAVSYLKHQLPLQFFYRDILELGSSDEFFSTMYAKSHIHATPYLLGIVTGVIIHRTRSHHKMYTWQSTLGLITAFLICVGCLIPGALILTKSWDYSALASALVVPQRRFFWAVGVSMFLLSLFYCKNSVISAALSCRPMVCLSKLAYSAYLVSLPSQLVHMASTREVMPMGYGNYARTVTTDIVWAFAIALVIYLTIEAPGRNITKLLFERRREKSATETCDE